MFAANFISLPFFPRSEIQGFSCHKRRLVEEFAVGLGTLGRWGKDRYRASTGVILSISPNDRYPVGILIRIYRF